MVDLLCIMYLPLLLFVIPPSILHHRCLYPPLIPSEEFWKNESESAVPYDFVGSRSTTSTSLTSVLNFCMILMSVVLFPPLLPLLDCSNELRALASLHQVCNEVIDLLLCGISLGSKLFQRHHIRFGLCESSSIRNSGRAGLAWENWIGHSG